MPQIPLMFMGDSPSQTSGLARILRDLATRTATLPEFRVATFGRGGQYSRYLPFPQYNFPETAQWGEDCLQEAWQDFAGSERGVLFTIWDATRLDWLALPEMLPECPVRRFLLSKPFDLWGYLPVDSRHPTGSLSAIGNEVVKRYDRVIAYSQFGAAAMGAEDWCPHGIDTSVFKLRSRSDSRKFLSAASQSPWKVYENDVLVGIVGTNQARKDWGLAAATLHLMKQTYGKRLKAWWHTDVLERSHAWNMMALIQDFGLRDNVLITLGGWNDIELAKAYAACNITLSPGMEGFGYSQAESMSAGIPVITGNGHGGSEFVAGAGGILVEPVADHLAGIHNAIRSVHSAQKWHDSAVALIADERDPKCVRQTVEYLDWSTLWDGYWRKYILAGAR